MTRASWAAALLLVSTLVLAQSPTQRLRGVVNDDGGTPINAAKVRLEAIWGFRGSDQFAGQRTFDAKSDKKGEWSVLGLTSGVWLFTAEAPDRLPQALMLPVKMMDRDGGSGAGGLLPWTIEFDLMAPVDSVAPFAGAVRPAFAGKKQEVFQILSPALESHDPKLLVAAGELLLIIKEPINAAKIFNRALPADPQNWRVHLGLGSAALMNADWNAATKSLWTARELAPAGYKQALSAAISDLQKIMDTK